MPTLCDPSPEAQNNIADPLAEEIARKLASGSKRVTLAELDAHLREIGYRLDRHMDCASINVYVAGPLAGISYPAVNMYVVQADDGMSATHVDARRDKNFQRLSEMRFNSEYFAVAKGRIYEL